MSSEAKNKKSSDEKPAITLPGTVEKIVPPVYSEPEKAQIHVEGADHLYKEIRVENTLKDTSGQEVKLKPGAHVEVTIEADREATVPKKPTGSVEPGPRTSS